MSQFQGAVQTGAVVPGLMSRVFHFGRRNPTLVLSILFLMLVVAMALLSPLLPYGAYRQDVIHRNALPSAAHWFGTDELGRDLFSRVAVGARVSLVIALTSTLIAVMIGATIGTISGLAGGI